MVSPSKVKQALQIKVCDASPHSIPFQPQVPKPPLMVFMLQMMLQKLVVVRTNLLISINWT